MISSKEIDGVTDEKERIAAFDKPRRKPWPSRQGNHEMVYHGVWHYLIKLKLRLSQRLRLELPPNHYPGTRNLCKI